MYRFLGFVILLATTTTLPLEAQQEAGDFELQLTGSLLSVVGQDDLSTTSGIIQAKAGIFLTDRVEVGGFPSLTFTRTTVRFDGLPDETVTESKFGMGVFGTYSFLAADASTVPYLGVQLYRIDLTDEDETGWAGVNGGFKFYMSRSTAFDVGGNALFGLGSQGGTLLLFQIGLSHLL